MLGRCKGKETVAHIKKLTVKRLKKVCLCWSIMFGKQGEMMYYYQNLEGVSLRDISQCLNAAFSDYAIPAHLEEEDLSGLFSASGIDQSLSFGAFFEGEMVGCMLNSRGIYQGYRAAFDVATGVVPEHRGKQVFAGLFALARQTMKQSQIQRYYLEVLQQNTPAISLY